MVPARSTVRVVPAAVSRSASARRRRLPAVMHAPPSAPPAPVITGAEQTAAAAIVENVQLITARGPVTSAGH